MGIVARRAVLGGAMRTAATVSMVSSARRNRAERQAIEQQTAANNQAPQQAPAQTVSDPTEELAKYAKLRDQGVITEEEFAAKKKQLLGL